MDNDKQRKLDKIISAIEEAHGVTIEKIRSRSGLASVTTARIMTAYAMYDAGFTHEEIAETLKRNIKYAYSSAIEHQERIKARYEYVNLYKTHKEIVGNNN